jgi:uncharacterized protein
VRLVLVVRDRADSAQQALENTGRKAQALESLFLELGIDKERWVTAGIGLEEWTQWDEPSRHEEHRGYIGSSSVVVTLPNADSLGRLLSEAVARADAAVEGPGWDILPSNPAHDESRRRAMADARRRAEKYADAADLLLGDPLQILEVGDQDRTKTMRLPVQSVAFGLSGGRGGRRHLRTREALILLRTRPRRCEPRHRRLGSP